MAGGPPFQSGISLSICLHLKQIVGNHYDSRVSIRHQPEYLPSLSYEEDGRVKRVFSFQSGISLSICLHTPRGGPASGYDMFQSGISLSICLHQIVGGGSDWKLVVSIRHQPEYLPSHSCPGRHGVGRQAPVSIRHQPEYLPSPARSRPSPLLG